MGGSGVQRPLKFIKYLREFGWNPIVLCPEPGAYHTFDESLLSELEDMNIEVHRVPSSTPFHWFSKKGKNKELNISNEKAKIFRKISRLIFYPDNKRGWIKSALKEAREIVSKENIEVIFSSAPPFSNHLAASRLSKETGIPLVLDYRDSWLNNHFMTDLYSWQRAIMKRQEEFALHKASKVVTLDDFMVKKITENHPNLSINTEVITHGFDEDDFKNTEKASFRYKEGKLNILYSGLFYEANQPDAFLEAIRELLNEEINLKDKIHLHFQGGVDKRIKAMIKAFQINEIVTDYGYLTHKEAVKNLTKADLLWFISNFSKDLKQIKSGKLFEYFGSGKPILGLVHRGEASKLLENYGAGFYASPDDISEIKSALSEVISIWKSDKFIEPKKEFINNFNRKSLTKRLASIFNVICN